MHSGISWLNIMHSKTCARNNSKVVQFHWRVQFHWPDAEQYEIHLHIVSDLQWTQEYGLHVRHMMHVSTGLHALHRVEQRNKAVTASTCQSSSREQRDFLKLG